MSVTPFLDHVAFLVASIEGALSGIEHLGLDVGDIESFPSEGTRECYLGGPEAAGRLLLMQPNAEDGPYADALARRGAGLHHVALLVDDLDRFIADRVEGSGWLVHPRSFETRRNASTIWLARPGVETLVECHETDARPSGPLVVEQVQLAGLDSRDGLASLFVDVAIDVTPGERSGVTIGTHFIASPEHGGL